MWDRFWGNQVRSALKVNVPPAPTTEKGQFLDEKSAVVAQAVLEKVMIMLVWRCVDVHFVVHL